MYIGVMKETTTIRITKETKCILDAYGKFGQNYSNCIENMHDLINKQKTQLKQKKQKKQK